MVSRRLLLVLTVLVAAMPRAWAQPEAAATAFIDRSGKELVQALNGPESEAQKRPRVQALVDRIVDVDKIAAFCLGRAWRTATPAQQTEYTRLFHSVLMNSILSKVGDYSGIGLTVGRAVPRDGDVAVATVVTRPNNAPANVQWIVADAETSPRIVDVIVEGTSLRLTQRSDYASFLARNNNNVDALVSAIRRQVGG